MPFLKGGGLGGEPDQGHYGGDWRRYYQAADRLERGQFGDSEYPIPAAEQANTALANGEIPQEKYDALQREIIETENTLRNLEQQANQSAMAVQRIAASGGEAAGAGGQYFFRG